MATEPQSPTFSPLIAGWNNASEVLGGTAKYFVNGANFEDPIQGSLANCYVIAAMSAVAEYNFDILRNCFQEVTTEYEPGESITVKLYSRAQREWVDIVVDDTFPVDSDGNSLVCKPPDANQDGAFDVKEAWIMFLEKACAQLCSWDEPDPGMQYELCQMGNTFCALQWMTGAEAVDVIEREAPDAPWYAKQVALEGAPDEKDGSFTDGPQVDTDQIWQMLRSADQKGELIIFGTLDGFTDEGTGLHKDHAYNIVKVLEMKSGRRVLGARNPHGQGELDEELQFDFRASEELEAEFDPTGDDGSFYIEFERFLGNVAQIGIVNYNTGTSRQEVLGEVQASTTYVVAEEGETLTSIAAADPMGDGVTPEELLALNPHLGLEEEDPEDPCNVVLPIEAVVLLRQHEARDPGQE